MPAGRAGTVTLAGKLAPTPKAGTLAVGGVGIPTANATVDAPAGATPMFFTTAVTVMGSAAVGFVGECDMLSMIRSGAESTAMKLVKQHVPPPSPLWPAKSTFGPTTRAANEPSRFNRTPIPPVPLLTAASVQRRGNGSATSLVNRIPPAGLGCASRRRPRIGWGGGGSTWQTARITSCAKSVAGNTE